MTKLTCTRWPALVATIGMASSTAVGLAADRPSRLVSPLSPTQNVIIENTSITTAEFWAAYTSEVPEQRRRAELFLLGVLDATEGVSWCDYQAFKTITIDEAVFSQLKKLLPKSGMSVRRKHSFASWAKASPVGGNNDKTIVRDTAGQSLFV